MDAAAETGAAEEGIAVGVRGWKIARAALAGGSAAQPSKRLGESHRYDSQRVEMCQWEPK